MASLVTSAQAVAFGYQLPPDTADDWLLQASNRIRRASGQSITSVTSTVRLPVDDGEIILPGPPITAVASVASVGRDGTVTPLDPVRDWQWDGAERICLLTYAEKADVVFTHGFVTLPDELIDLVCSVARRLSVTPVGMEAGIRSVTIDDYSRTFAAEARTDAASLLPGERDELDSILAVPTVHVVRSK